MPQKDSAEKAVRDIKESVYRDNCCHVNPYRNEIVAREIARIIRESLEPETTDPRL